MGKIRKIRKPKVKFATGEKGWEQFGMFWGARGLGPEEASNILAENWLEKGWTNYSHNIFKDPIMRYEFMPIGSGVFN